MKQSDDYQKDLEAFYDCMKQLEDGLKKKLELRNCTNRDDLPMEPEKGVYFFFEEGQTRTGGEDLRVVRVGTHALKDGAKSTLWKRLKQHKGTLNGTGNSGSSVFRRHVKNALNNSNKGDKTTETDVSDYIGKMPFIYISVPDKADGSSDRAYIEKNAIGLLSEFNKDKTFTNWLGENSPENIIKESGLWNKDHVFRGYDRDFLGVLKTYVDATIGLNPQP